MKKAIVIFWATFFAVGCAAQISPFDFGLREANGGMGRYFALLNAHRAALEKGVDVDYSGIDTLYLELPPGFASIPIGRHTDFGGLVLFVTNHAHHGALFAMHNSSEPVELDKRDVDALEYSHVPGLEHGTRLLVLHDATPWTERRGFGYKAYREDLILVHDGKGQNRPVAPWNTESTDLKASCTEVDTSPKVFRSLTLHRTAESTCKTYCLSLSGVYNFVVEDIHVTTPRSRMIADGIINIRQSARITLRNINIEGTYSGYGRTRNYGYAFALNNVYDLRCQHITAWGNWGVFGANNMNQSLLEDCEIDRYDVHCYGRDITMRRCHLSKRQTPISSIFGTVRFDSCTFSDFIPVRIRSSYNAYTPFDIEIHDCIYEATPRYHSLIQIDLLDTADNPRPELASKCLPNLTVDGLTVEVPLAVGRFYLYHPTDNLKDLKRKWAYIRHVHINRLRMVRKNGRPAKIPIRLYSHPFKTINPLDYRTD